MQAVAPPAAPAAAPQPASAAPFDWQSVDWSALLANWAIAAVILLLGYWLAKWISRILDRALTRGGVEATLSGFLRNIAYAAMMVLVFIAALQKIGVPTTSVLAVVGAAGLAVGLALKDSLSNIASGVMLIVLRPFRAGDNVRVAGLEGVVEQVRIFTTQLRTAQNEVIVMPNSEITTNPIVNLTGHATRRVDVKVTVGYEERIDRCREVLLVAAKANPKVLPQPAADVVVENLAAGGIELMLRAWAATADHAQVRSELIEAAHRELGAAGIAVSAPPREYRLVLSDDAGAQLRDRATPG